MFIRLVLAGAIGSLVVPAAARVTAQSTSSGPSLSHPYRGLFGPTASEEQRSERLSLTFSVYGAADDNSNFAGGNDILDATLQSRRVYQGAQGGLTFVRRRRHSALVVTGASTIRYYSDLRRVVTQTHTGEVRMDLFPTRTWKFQFAQSASYLPYYQLVLDPMSPIGSTAPPAAMPNTDYSVWHQQQITYGSSVGTIYSPDPRTEVRFGYSVNYTDFFVGPDSNIQRTAAQYTRRLGRDLDLRLGYTYGSNLLPGLAATHNHDLDLGVGYRRSFSLTPRTSFGFSSGSTLVSTDDGIHPELTGSVQLRRQISALWSSQIEYQRNLQLLTYSPNPYLAGTVVASLTGFLSRHVGLRLFPSYTTGTDVADATKRYHGFTSQARVEVAVNRHWAWYIEHLYFEYRFSQTSGLPSALTAGVNRQGLRTGLTLWSAVIR